MTSLEAHAIRNFLQVAIGYSELGQLEKTVQACREIDALCVVDPERPKMPLLSESYVPLSHAHLCLNCFAVGPSLYTCPACKTEGPHLELGRMMAGARKRRLSMSVGIVVPNLASP